ncbi:MAG: metallophosphoesterase [Clostridia bacterium]|nr:metallophosphoesterase [Clostridia bacterium]
MKKLKCAAIAIILILCFALCFVLVGKNFSDKTQTEVFSIGNSSGIKITALQISDLHYPKNGCSFQDIYDEIERIRPDLIFLTGDVIDSSTEKEFITELDAFFAELAQSAICFAVLGNHEAINSYLLYFKQLLSKNSILLLENDSRQIQLKGKNLCIAGVSDKVIYGNTTVKGYAELDKSLPLLLLAHRPEKWPQYLEDALPPLVTFAGHAHGGQFRFFGKGVYSPGQGCFPKYDSGLYQQNDKHLIVSRGLGNSIFSFRLYNRYHLPVAEIYL